MGFARTELARLKGAGQVRTVRKLGLLHAKPSLNKKIVLLIASIGRGMMELALLLWS
jgi:hypothetical protein